MRRNAFTVTVAFTLTIGAIALAAGPTSAQGTDPGKAPAAGPVRQLTFANKLWTGDFDEMLERRMIRALVPYSRTLYYTDQGRERGVTAEMVRELERSINRKYATKLGKRPLTVVVVPTTRDKLIPGVVEGLGDIAAGNITVTEGRRERVDFVAPADLQNVSEIVVAGPRASAVKTVDDLSGKTVHVRPSTSYHESLVALNARFQKEGKPPVVLVLLPDALADEDKMELVNAGLLDLVIVDDWLAKIWAQVLPGITLVREAAVRTGGRTGWAIRQRSPKLQAALEDFYRSGPEKKGLVGYLKAQELRRVKQIRDNTRDEDRKRFAEVVDLFRKYGEKYRFDPIMLAAQGYQESQLNQDAKSHVGAIGVMQVMPATGAQLNVGDIRVTEPNIHAGVKYLDQLMTRYFPDGKFSEANRPLFAFAAYNAGPGNIARMRKLAAERGFDPDEWFNHVEVVTAEKVGIETTTYVRNIFKYYVGYRLVLEQREQGEKLKERMRKGG
jgi:membrane-bound lytic murein transglycosylase MltF